MSRSSKSSARYVVNDPEGVTSTRWASEKASLGESQEHWKQVDTSSLATLWPLLGRKEPFGSDSGTLCICYGRTSLAIVVELSGASYA
mmetsp:Transcript_15782/g.47896  ORF Transcript_15782/g.47896 Transcript_15782/m.47896 type:complete len:88 (-) Transcript_15782:55-318(-)